MEIMLPVADVLELIHSESETTMKEQASTSQTCGQRHRGGFI